MYIKSNGNKNAHSHTIHDRGAVKSMLKFSSKIQSSPIGSGGVI